MINKRNNMASKQTKEDIPALQKKPNIDELIEYLKELTEWEPFAYKLMQGHGYIVREIEKNNKGNVRNSKVELFTKWLKVNPTASWMKVIDALNVAEEYALAEDVKNAIISKEGKVLPPRIVHDNRRSKPTEIELSPDSPIKDKVAELHAQFVSMVTKIIHELTTEVEKDYQILARIITFAALYIYQPMETLSTDTIYTLFGKLQPHYDFINCELIEAIVNDFLNGHELHLTFQNYIIKLDTFLESHTLLDFKKAIEKGMEQKQECTDTTCKVVIKLSGRWGPILLRTFREVVKFIMGEVQFTHIDIQTGSVVVSFLAPITQLQSLVDSASLKIEFMNRIGIIEMYISDPYGNLYQIMSPIDESSINYDQSLLVAVNEGHEFEISILLKLGANITKESYNDRSTCQDQIELAPVSAPLSPQEAPISFAIHQGASQHQESSLRPSSSASTPSLSPQIKLLLPPENQPQLSTSSDHKSTIDVSGSHVFYKMNDPSSTSPQGYCIIINNNDGSYYGEEQLEEMRRVFGDQLGFHVQIYTNLTRKAIHHLLTALANTDHSDLHCLMVIVLSKGGKEKVVYGSDGKKIHLKDIMTPFSNNLCPSLSSKPKLFFTDTQLVDDRGRVKNTTNLEEVLEIPDDTLVVNHFSREERKEEKRYLVELTDVFCDEFVFQDEMTTFTMDCDDVMYKDNLDKPLHFTRRPARDSINDEGPRVAEELKLALKVLSTLRDASIEELETKRDYIFRFCQNVRRARMAGAVTSLVGGGIAIVGFALAPVTLGGSIVISIVGAGVGVAGGALSVGSIVSKKLESKNKLKKIDALLEVDRQLTDQVNNNLFKKLDDLIKKIQKRKPNTNIEEAIATVLYGGKHSAIVVTVATKTGVGAAQAARTAVHSSIFTLRVAGSAARGVAVAGGVITALTIPIDIYELTSNSIRLYKKSDTETIKKFNGHLKVLHEEKETIQKMLQELTAHKLTTPPSMPLEPPSITIETSV